MVSGARDPFVRPVRSLREGFGRAFGRLDRHGGADHGQAGGGRDPVAHGHVSFRIPSRLVAGKKAVRQHELPDKITIDKSGANAAAIEALIEETGHEIEIRQNKYLNNRVEQDHRAVKRIVRAMLRFMSFRAASIILRGIELVHMLKKGQMNAGNGQNLSAAEQFYFIGSLIVSADSRIMRSEN